MHIAIRDATAPDKRAVANVHVRSWQVAYRGLLPNDYLDDLRPEDRASRYTFGGANSSPSPTTLVACDGDVVCGFVTFEESQDEPIEAFDKPQQPALELSTALTRRKTISEASSRAPQSSRAPHLISKKP